MRVCVCAAESANAHVELDKASGLDVCTIMYAYLSPTGPCTRIVYISP